jgi:hypothetical protein
MVVRLKMTWRRAGLAAHAKPHEIFRTVVAECLPRGFRHYALKGRYRLAATADRRAVAERCARLGMAVRIEWNEVPARQLGLDWAQSTRAVVREFSIAI